MATVSQKRIDELTASIQSQFQEGVRKMRAKSGMSQKEFAEAAQTHKQNIVKYEGGSAIPTLTYTLPYILAVAGYEIEIKFKPLPVDKEAAKKAAKSALD